MKTLRFLIASTAAAALAATVSAQEVKIAGSTAFRAAAVAGIIDSLNSPTAAFIGTNISSANQAVITGTLKSGSGAGQTITFQLAWSGSLSGLNAVTSTTTLASLPGASFAAAQTWLSSSGNGLATVSVTSGNNGYTYTFTGGTPVTAGTATFEAFSNPNAAFSDAFIESTAYSSFLNHGVSEYSGGTAPAGVVGIIPFAWVKGPQGAGVSTASYQRLTNITSDLANNLLTSGVVPLPMFTGNSSDAGIDVVLTGRNNDSGTRFAAVAEAGVLEGAGLTQYAFTTSASAITAFGFSPNTGTVNGLGQVDGNSAYDGNPYDGDDGQSSGGNVANWVKLPPAASAQTTGVDNNGNTGVGELNGVPFIVVSYLGTSDAKTVTTFGGATASGETLSYNGVPANILLSSGSFDIFAGTTNTDLTGAGFANTVTTPLATLIQNGQYGFWEYEHLYYRSSLSGTQLFGINLVHATIVSPDALAAGLFAVPNPNIGLSVSRGSEFTPPFTLLSN